uniref:Uncharacterized protein n=1 Tax=Ixodes ricinus TaxID=34613 RepID=A0A6B0V622_IXORI
MPMWSPGAYLSSLSLLDSSTTIIVFLSSSGSHCSTFLETRRLTTTLLLEPLERPKPKTGFLSVAFLSSRTLSGDQAMFSSIEGVISIGPMPSPTQNTSHACSKTLLAQSRKDCSWPRSSSPVVSLQMRSPPKSPRILSTYLPYAQKLGYALEPSPNTANLTLLRGPRSEVSWAGGGDPVSFSEALTLFLRTKDMDVVLGVVPSGPKGLQLFMTCRFRAKTSPFSGGSPLPKVLEMTRSKGSNSRLTKS